MKASTPALPVLAICLLSTCQALYLIYSALSGILLSDQKGPAAVAASFYLILTLALAVGSWGLWAGHRFGHSLLLVWQLFALIIGVQTATAGFLVLGIASSLISGCQLLLLFSGPTLSHLKRAGDK